MIRLLIVVLIGVALAVPPVRAHIARLLGRPGRGTHVGVVPAPDRR